MSFQRKKGKKGSKKYGRNKIKCERYSREKRREKNKIRKIRKHLRTHPRNKVAQKRLNELIAFVQR